MNTKNIVAVTRKRVDTLHDYLEDIKTALNDPTIGDIKHIRYLFGRIVSEAKSLEKKWQSFGINNEGHNEEVKYACINTTRQEEQKLRDNGFTIPLYPKAGEVLYKGKVVGYVDLAGLNILSEEAIEKILTVFNGRIKIFMYTTPYSIP